MFFVFIDYYASPFKKLVRWKTPSIDFVDAPFFLVSTQIKTCQHGTDRHLSWKKLRMQKKEVSLQSNLNKLKAVDKDLAFGDV